MLRVGLLGDARVKLAEALTELGAVAEVSDDYEATGVRIERAEEPFSRFQLVVGAGKDVDEAADAWIEDEDSEHLRDAIIALWKDRIVPFEFNLRNRKRAPRIQRAVICAPGPTWQTRAERLVSRLDYTVGERAIRIDHIGSTSVPDLPSKDLIDLQIVVGDPDTAAKVSQDTIKAGFVPVSEYLYVIDQHDDEREEWVAVDADPGRPVNVHIHPLDSPVWREMLLFRDWLRSDSGHRDEYVSMKRSLAARSDRDVNDYGKDKEPWIRAAISRAESWAVETGWTP